jgi:2-isopropylmalate synthase
VANSLAAVLEGVEHVQGTINGFGERCGNANLISIVPNLALKLGVQAIPDPGLRELREVARYASELANRTPWQHQPFVGDSAFAHKAGMHVSAVLKHPETYEHVSPELVGNRRRVLVSELAGRSNILWKAQEYGLDLAKDTPETRRILETLKALEDEGYLFEGAEASFELLMERALGNHRAWFELEGYRVTVEARQGDREPFAEATVRLSVKGIAEHTAATGNGPVNALDHALRQGLVRVYPELEPFELIDFKVRILDSMQGTDAVTRVLIEMTDGQTSWSTVGVGPNLLEASWEALTDATIWGLRNAGVHPR